MMQSEQRNRTALIATLAALSAVCFILILSQPNTLEPNHRVSRNLGSYAENFVVSESTLVTSTDVTASPTATTVTSSPTPSYTEAPTYTQWEFFVDQVIYGVTYSEYLADKTAVQETISKTVVSALYSVEELDWWYVEYLEVAENAEIGGITLVYSVNYDDQDNYQALNTQLTSAVDDGTFTTLLQAQAKADDVSVLYNASSYSCAVFEFTKNPTFEPSAKPTMVPTESPTNSPTDAPTYSPTDLPTNIPTEVPTEKPSADPTYHPTSNPTTSSPTLYPTSGVPSDEPTYEPTSIPTTPTNPPTSEPTYGPTHKPTLNPTSKPTHKPTYAPTHKPTKYPTALPTANPTDLPTAQPTYVPTATPTNAPTLEPTFAPVYILIANQVVEGISSVEFDKYWQNASYVWVETVYSVLNGVIPRDDIAVEEVFAYTGQSGLETQVSGTQKGEEEPVFTEDTFGINLIYWVTFYDGSIYSTLYDDIQTAVDSGNFTARLQAFAADYDVSVLEDATTSEVSMYEFTSSPTPAPSLAPTEPTPVPTASPSTQQPSEESTQEPSEETTLQPTEEMAERKSQRKKRLSLVKKGS